ncbi:sugar transferase [Limosilactobacillus gastricus]|uniref:sugar transferase n=1 Tax=Limosilactobacillus gastricus TaxID=227942 RepID=UPI0026EF701F|nr:sugar transferase [Limosilactobacillus gastricus]
MKINITNLYGMAANSTAQLAQNKVTNIAKELGFNELGIYYYNALGESEEQRASRIDGILASVGVGDIIIFQLPTWNAIEYDRLFLQRARAYGVKIVMFVQDILPLMFKSDYHDWMPVFVDFYDQSDYLILPSPNMEAKLREEGLTMDHDHIIFQRLWDHPTNFEPQRPTFERKLSFTGQPERFPFIKNWHFTTPVDVYTLGDPEQFQDLNINFKGFYPDELLLYQLNRGLGLCWSENSPEKDERDYSKWNASYKLSTYLAAGMPVVANRDISCADLIEEHHLGILADTLAEADQLVQSLSEDEYNTMADNAVNLSFLLRHGHITKELLLETVRRVLSF